jgi:hypothetical protein
MDEVDVMVRKKNARELLLSNVALLLQIGSIVSLAKRNMGVRITQ